MHRKLWLSAVMAALGALLLVVAGFAHAASSSAAKKGGTMRMNMSATDVDFSDPSLAYGTISWQIEYATALKLLNYPDKGPPLGSRLQPEAASGLPIISNNGKTYTFTIKRGLRFSDGSKVTARNFKWAFDRSATKAQQSPATAFMDSVVGYTAAVDGGKNPAHVSGVIARGNKLIIRLREADGGLLAKLAMPFFQAISLKTKVDPHGVNAYPSAGPYYIASRIVNRRIVVKKNKFYKGNRPRNIDTFDITVNTNLDQSLLQVRSNQVDYDMGGLPSTAHADLAKRYGVNKGQYQVHQLVETDYVALNTSRPTFANTKLRKAANFAIDRPAMLRVRGAFAGKRTDQVLPPNMRGFKDAKIYPLKGADYRTAKRLAGSSCKDVTLYTATSPTGQNLAQVFKYNLSQIGCNVNVKSFVGFAIYTAAGTRGEPFDAALVGWNQDYPDPYDFLNILLDGNNIHADNNNNLAYFNNKKVNRLLEAANRLTGPARYKRYGSLDLLISKNYAPWAAYDNRNEREFVSKRTGGYLFQPANASADLNTFFIK
ncbi:MAG TPA: ABC transporter substrate-binding protein [Gaiellaceae bacterium]|nr:ABC transporter substrate-binding protein [Gaiellaceae bacterium]